MALQKQSYSINFEQGLSTKIDAIQLPIGKFVRLENTIFDTIGRLTKRNGFQSLTQLPDSTSTFLTTFNGNLTAIGQNINSYSPTTQGLGLWTKKGSIVSTSLSTMPLIRNNSNQNQSDSAVSTNGFICTAYTESQTLGSTTTNVVKYAIADVTTGQNIVAPTKIVTTGFNVVFGAKAFSVGNNFLIVYTANTASSYQLQYYSVNILMPTTVGGPNTITTDYLPISNRSFDGVVSKDTLYLAWAANPGIMACTIGPSLVQSSPDQVSSTSATIVSSTIDQTSSTSAVYTAYYSTASNSGEVIAYNTISSATFTLTPLFSAKQFVSSSTAQLTNITLTATEGLSNVYYEVTNSYGYDSSIPTNFLKSFTINRSGSVSATSFVSRSVGLASKGFLIGSQSYFLSTYQSPYQSTYFLMNSTGGIISKLAYGNGVGYLTNGLPQVSVLNGVARFSYLLKTTIEAVNKNTGVGSTTQTAGIFSQTGINLANYTFSTANLSTSEIGNNLHINGGLLSSYDGFRVVEQGFHLYPDSVKVTTSGVNGSISAQTYFYRATYEWSDNQGNLFKSAPSIPVSIVVGSNTSSNTISVPTLRLTQKTDNPVKIVLYRWSTGQQTYYQTTSISMPVTNSTSSDHVVISDYSTDASILGNNILYTEGGVLENIAFNGVTGMTIFDNRLWGIDAENQNLLRYSKQIIQSVPVEPSDLLTIFVSPTSSAQGPTGPCKCLAPMDDKLIIFKKNAIYYINGAGPDNTGANSGYSEPTFITGTIGCENQNSIIMTPNGLMFQSDKGIWLLGRDLSTQYIGQDVEAFNAQKVLSAVQVPATNQIRFTLDNNKTLVYDYFVGQWGSFKGIPGISSTLYENKHTFIDSYGKASQELPGSYLDGSNPVTIGFTTGWISLAGLQGYKRIYKAYLLGEYKTPHRLTMGIAYDYDSNISQQATILPDNFTGNWGSGSFWGAVSFWGGNSYREQWQIGFEQQQCQSIQLVFDEYYDSTFGIAAGAGLTLSGIALVSGLKSTYPRNIPATHKTS